MKPKSRTLDNEAFLTFEKLPAPGGMYLVLLRDPSGEVHTKTCFDTYTEAFTEYRRLCQFARTL